MFKTKKEVDLHVRTALAKLRTENEKNLRSFTIAKLYFKINEFSTAEQYVSSYLTIKDDNDQAHKLLGQCYLRQKKPDKALAAFQRSLQLNPKQPDLLAEVCQLMIEDKALNTNKAKYWCDLAESEKVQHDAVFSLRLKLMNKDNLETNQIEELIQKEISSRPQDVNLRIRLVRHFVEQNKILDAFQYTCQMEMKNHNILDQSAEWYNVVWLVLSKYEQIPNTKKDWQFWLLLITCLERQVNISFTTNRNLPNGGTTETANLLFNFDQYLFKLSQISDTLNQQKEFVSSFMEHYQGQLCLHAASLIFKREMIQNRNKWKDTIKSALPLLLLAYQSKRPDLKEPWTKHCDEHGKLLLQLWDKEGAFRCAQAGRTLYACVEENHEKQNEFKSQLGDNALWTTIEKIMVEIRQTVTDKNWRRNIFGLLFCNGDQKLKDQTSHFIKSNKLEKPINEIPSYAEVEQHEEAAQFLNPQSLQHMVYLCLGNDHLENVRSKFFSGLNFSTQNLSFCGSESLNQLDVETFLYAATLHAKRLLQLERETYNRYHSESIAKPKILPFVNIQDNLCTEEQMNWWTATYQVYKNLASENLAEIRANLQYGLEAVRGINGPKIDMIIVFKLGKIFEKRAADVAKPMEKAMLEARSEHLYRYGLNMLKLNNRGVLEPYKRYFKYASANSSSVEREVATLAEDAITFLVTKYFKKSEYEEVIEEMADLQLPLASYYQFDAYRKLEEANKTPKKSKRIYLDKASECLNQTLQLLKSSHVDPQHPLNNIVPHQMSLLQQRERMFFNEQNQGNNSSSYEDAETDFALNDSSAHLNGNNRSRREVSFVTSTRTAELENLVKQIASMMVSVKEELIENIKPEVVGLKKEVATLKEKLVTIEENMRKKSNPPSQDDNASNVLDDLYIIEDELQNQMYSNQQQQQQQQQMNLYGSAYSQPHSMAPRMHTPTAVAGAGVPVPGGPVNPYSSPLYGNYAMNYYAQQFMMPPQQGAAAGIGATPLANRNTLGLSYMDSPMNFNLPGLNAASILPPSTDNRSSNLYGLLTQNPPQQQTLGAPIQQQPAPQLTLPTTPLQSITMPPKPQQPTPMMSLPTVSAPSSITFNKSLNNLPVEKGPPVNVVITSSDPLPTSNAGFQTQPTLSVTIPSHHIKPSLVATSEQSTVPPLANTNFPMVGPPPSTTSPFSMKFPTPIATTMTTTTTTTNPPAFSFKPPPPTSSVENLNKTNDSISSLNKSETEIEYDPNPDFKPIIPLPDEVEVKTGEEDEEVMFCSRARLFRHVDKEWKERGIGDIKILKNKENGTSRILMRRDQTHKICANHRISGELNLKKPKDAEKSFIWAANDFADEELKRETFLVRFKLVETAEKFEAAFNVARKESEDNPKVVNGDIANKPKPFGFGTLNNFSDNKTSTPAPKIDVTKTKQVNSPATTTSSTLPKTLFDTAFGKAGTGETKTQTTSPFANFSFDKATAEPKPFANIFASLNNTQPEISPINVTPKVTESKTESHNKSDHEDEYVPTAEFKPVIPLPDLVEVTTGEENETVLFEHRAKLLRFDKTAGEWKERGLGNIKVLQDKNDVNKVRLVMRREIIHKLCCNQRLYKDIQFQPMKNSKNALVWVGQDFSESELQKETLAVRFKTADTCKQFLDVILEAQAKMSSSATEENAKIEEESTKKSEKEASVPEKGFGDKFKPKAGSWSCDQCYTSNTSDKLYCASCEAPKDNTIPKKEPAGLVLGTATTIKSPFSFGFGTAAATKAFVANEAADTAKQENLKNPTVPSVTTKGFGDKFKPKEGSWSCEQCYTNNTAEKLYCASCEAPKDKTVPNKEPTSILDTNTSTKFNFGFNQPAKPASVTFAPAESSLATTGFGDKFKAKEGSWSCTDCYLSNTSDALYCNACNAPKDSTVPKKDPIDILAPSNPSQKFNFGFAAAGTNASTIKNDVGSFTFGTITTNATTAGSQNTSSVGGTTGFQFGKGDTLANTQTNIFGGSNNGGPLNISTTKLGESKSFSFTPASSVVSSAPNNSTTATGTIAKSSFSFNLAPKTMEQVAGKDSAPLTSTFSLDKKEFNFVLKTKSPGKAKSPHKAINSPGGGEDDDDEEVAEEEENNTYFTPVIPLPDKIEVKTGEEDEEIMYCHRAKLFRLTEGEWKERGLGDVKILRHKETKKLRVVMRRELVLKICLNHALFEDIIYKKKDEKCWLFCANDYSEGEVQLSQFCLRFKNKEIADDFMKAVTECLEGKREPVADSTTSDDKSKQPVSEIKISDEDKKIADKLSLPYSFFDGTSFVPCSGCRGCDPDKFVFPKYSPIEKENDNPLPLDMSNISISRPSRSVVLGPSKLGTDSSTQSSNLFGNSVFGSNTNSATTFSFTQALNSTTKQDEKSSDATGGFLFGGPTAPTVFGGASDKSIFGKTTLFGSNADTNASKSIFGGTGTSVFGNNNKINDVDTSKSIFGGTGTSVFGNSTSFSKPLFGGSQPATTVPPKESSQTIFGNSTAPVFGSKSSIPKPTFGMSKTESSTISQPTFGSSGPGLLSSNIPKPVFGGNSSIFNSQQTNDSNNQFSFGNLATGNKSELETTAANENIAPKNETGENVEKPEGPFLFSEAIAQFKINENEKSGETTAKPSSGFIGLTHHNDAFSSFKNTKNTNNTSTKDLDASGDAAAGGDEHDPHFEPIIPLPDQIVLSTGEEDEDKLFGERVKLFRYDAVNKEWKERGVGELKILQHKTKGTYRMVMRREQIHKLVLNHGVGADFSFNPIGSNDRSYLWAAMNFAEDQPSLEKLSVRFRNVDDASRFNKTLTHCIQTAKSRAELEPEQD